MANHKSRVDYRGNEPRVTIYKDEIELNDDVAAVSAKGVNTLISKSTLANGSAINELRSAHPQQIIAFCAESGMGKTTLLNLAIGMHSAKGAEVRYEDLQGMRPIDVEYALRDVSRWCTRKMDRGQGTIVAFDNFPAGDEAEVEEQVRMLRAIARKNCIIVLGMAPEAESLLDRLAEAVCYWSCDLVLQAQADLDDGALDKWEWTHGIPALEGPMRRLAGEYAHAPMTNPAYQEAYVNLVLASLRPCLIGEESQLRLAMLLMGHGTLEELNSVLDRVDEDIWRLMARDAPLFGIDLGNRSYACVANESTDGLSVAFKILQEEGAGWPMLVSRCANVLAGREEMSRAALVSQMCSDERERISIALKWCADFVNAGEVGVVSEALDAAREGGFVGLEGMREAAVFLLAAMGEDPAKASANLPWGNSMRRGGMSRLEVRTRLAALSASLPHGVVEESHPDALQGDVISEGLVLHLEAWSLFVRGRPDIAHVKLLESPVRMGRPSVVSSLLYMDYMLFSLLCGITPSEDELDAYAEKGEFLESAGLSLLRNAHDAVIPMACLVAGRRRTTMPIDVHLHRANRLGMKLLKGMYLLALAVGDMRIAEMNSGILTRAHVRLEQALGIFGELRLPVMAMMARALYLTVHHQLGERVSKPDLIACRGGTKSLDHVVTVLTAAMASSPQERACGAGRWGATRCPHEVHSLVNVLGWDAGALSKAFRDVEPQPWKDSVARSSTEVDAFFELVHPTKEEGEKQARDMRVTTTCRQTPGASLDDAPVEITLLGGLEVRVRGVPLPGKKLERRRAKSLFVLLAAVPGHAVKRFTVMESVWPEHDYSTAMHYVYAATSVIRSVLGKAVGDEAAPLIVANKSEGTLAFDDKNVRCDVDLFEERAHRILDNQEDDGLVLTLCREVEDLYKGDLFVPPTDGMGIIETRARELRELFADVMVVGSAAANNVGSRMLACRLARKAHEADELREDAMHVLAESLCAAGRHVEAEQSFEEYVSRVIDVTHRPPSKELRQSVYRMLQGIPRTSPTHDVAGGRDATSHVEIVESHSVEKSGQMRLSFGAEDMDG